MAFCYVEMRGLDDEIHYTRVDAPSVFAAAEMALVPWVRLWWYSPKANVTVKRDDKCWIVKQERLREWRKQMKER